MRKRCTAVGLLVLALVVAGCSKREEASSGAASSTAVGAATATATATASAPSAAAAASAPSAAAAASAPSAAAASSADAACGARPLPDCPLQGWMKANTTAQVADRDYAALATALDKIATFAPAGYTNWGSIARDGARAARVNDMTAVKASCRTCHDQYKKKYKAEMRDRKI